VGDEHRLLQGGQEIVVVEIAAEQPYSHVGRDNDIEAEKEKVLSL
jgi:hypothetical protein